MKTALHNDILIQSIEASNLSHSISSADGDHELLYVNDAFEYSTGYSKNEAIGRNCRFLQGEGTNPETLAYIRAAIANRTPIDTEILNYKKDGSPFWNRIRISPVFDQERQVVAFIGIQSDVTPLREQQRIQQEQQKLEALGRLSANISHEIKNAIQPLKLVSDTLSNWEHLNPQQLGQCAQLIQENVQIADQIVQDVLQFSRKNDPKNQSYSADALSQEVIRFIQNMLTRHVELKADIGNSEELSFEPYLNINQQKLFQVLINLINNALHAMNNQGILRLSWQYQQLSTAQAMPLQIAGGPYLNMQISDTGVGMSPQILKSIFDPFFSTKSPEEGTGLGLPIIQRYVRDWGGSIQVESQVNQGSTFSIFLPLTTSTNET